MAVRQWCGQRHLRRPAGKIKNILFVLSRARKPEDVDLPGLHLHPLNGAMKGLWTVTVRANCHMTFPFEEGEACDVDVVDYHEEETSDAYEEPTLSRPHCSARVHYTARPVRDRSRLNMTLRRQKSMPTKSK